MLIILIIAASIAGTLGAYTFYSEWYVLDVQEVPVRFQVSTGQTIGFALDKDVLAFGRIPPGGKAERGATIESYLPSRAVITMSDNLASILTTTENNILLEARTPQQINFVLSIPESMDAGNYTGQVRITYFRRP